MDHEPTFLQAMAMQVVEELPSLFLQTLKVSKIRELPSGFYFVKTSTYPLSFSDSREKVIY